MHHIGYQRKRKVDCSIIAALRYDVAGKSVAVVSPIQSSDTTALEPA